MIRKFKYVILACAILSVFWLWWWHFSSPGWPLQDRIYGSNGLFQTGAALKGARTEAGITATRDKIYIVGGINAWGQTLSSFVAYDPVMDVWEILPDLPEPLNHPGVVSDGDNVFVVGGFGPLGIRLRGFMFARWDARSAVYIYNIKNRAWSRGKDLPEARGGGAVSIGDGAIWYAGGIRENMELSSDLFKFDFESGSWSRMPVMPTPRDHLRLEYFSGRLYAISGRKDDLRFNLPNVETYEIKTNSWMRASDILVPRGGLASVVFGSYIYTFGGESVWDCFDVIERYDPQLDKWEIVDRLPEARHGIGAAVINGRIHLIGGGRHPRISVSSIHRIYTPANE